MIVLLHKSAIQMMFCFHFHFLALVCVNFCAPTARKQTRPVPRRHCPLARIIRCYASQVFVIIMLVLNDMRVCICCPVVLLLLYTVLLRGLADYTGCSSFEDVLKLNFKTSACVYPYVLNHVFWCLVTVLKGRNV